MKCNLDNVTVTAFVESVQCTTVYYGDLIGSEETTSVNCGFASAAFDQSISRLLALFMSRRPDDLTTELGRHEDFVSLKFGNKAVYYLFVALSNYGPALETIQRTSDHQERENISSGKAYVSY